MADFIRCPRCNRLFTVEDGGELPEHTGLTNGGRDACVAINHPTHTFGTVDDCIRCLDCEVLFCGSQSGTPCPAHREREPFPSDPKQYNIPPVKPSVFGSRRAITGCEQTLVWDSDSGRYLHQEDIF
jgi:hypothetical protein